MNRTLSSLLGNKNWLRQNAEALKKLLPQTWTHMDNLSQIKIAFGLKPLGLDWRTTGEFGEIMVFRERAGLMQRDGLLVRANPHFDPNWT